MCLCTYVYACARACVRVCACVCMCSFACGYACCVSVTRMFRDIHCHHPAPIEVLFCILFSHGGPVSLAYVVSFDIQLSCSHSCTHKGNFSCVCQAGSPASSGCGSFCAIAVLCSPLRSQAGLETLPRFTESSMFVRGWL